ncbi:MAG: hypothetical protein LH618_14445 [Saprospiraceae bacterium]|nr:hypothetical protein [Saprospiraceae bacterium]
MTRICADKPPFLVRMINATLGKSASIRVVCVIRVPIDATCSHYTTPI